MTTVLCIIGWLVAGILAAIVIWFIKDYDGALDRAYEQGRVEEKRERSSEF